MLCIALLIASMAGTERNVDLDAESLRFGFPDEFARHFHSITVPEGKERSGYQAGYRREALATLRSLRKRAATPLPWIERGPGNVGGRTRALVIDANDPSGNTLFAGSVGGGIWKSEDAGNNWSALTDDAPRLSVTSIAQAPSNPDVLYAGTGEGFPNGDAAIGDGILKSVDGGLTWSVLPSTSGGTDFLFVNRVIVSDADEHVVLAATRSGIWRSADGGGSWNQVLAPDSFWGFYQILAEPGNFATQYAVGDGRGVWKSVDSGLNWTSANDGLLEAGSGARIELDISPADPARLYALVESAEGADPTYVSTDRAATWVELVAAGGSSNADIAGTQGWYDLMVHAHPADPERVFLGGIQLYGLRQSAGSSVRSVFGGADEDNTRSFLSFVDFGATHLGGGLRLGTEEEESTITENRMVSVEVRFGAGQSQMAHRFVPEDAAGVDFVDYPWVDYVEVPFEVWDITNDQQLGISFRDRENNGVFDLSEYNPDDIDREYVLISARPYTGQSPDAALARNGGLRTDLAYFFWPVLAPGGTWDPNALPESTLRLNWSQEEVGERVLSQVGSGVHVDQHIMRSIRTGPGDNDFRLVLGNDGGVFVSNDGGQNWNERFRSYNTTQFYGVDKKPGRTVYLGGTQDNGSWRSLGNPGPASSWFGAGGGDGFDVLWHKQNDQRMLTTSQYTAIRRSTNGGINFSNATSGLQNSGQNNGSQFITSLSARADNSEIVYTLGESGVWRSSDFAESWQLRSIAAADWGYSGSSGKVHVSNADGDVVWAGYEMDPSTSGADNAGALHRSGDDGATFNATTTPSWAPGRLSGLSSSYEDADVVYVTFSFFGRPKIIRSMDGGQSWEDLSGFRTGSGDVVSSNGFPDVSTYDVVDFPGTNVIWAATEIGIVESLDDGDSWQLADNGLPAVSIWQMKIRDDEVVVATHGRGIWTLPLNAVPTSTSDEDVLPSQLQIDSAWPNPFTDVVTLSVDLPESGLLRIEIFDLLGRRVASVLDEHRTAGRHEVSWDAHSQASGSYWARVSSAREISTRALVKVN
jgi:hypothetical protein